MPTDNETGTPMNAYNLLLMSDSDYQVLSKEHIHLHDGRF